MKKFLFLDFAAEHPVAGILGGGKAEFFSHGALDGVRLLPKLISRAGKDIGGIIAVAGPGRFSAVRGTVVSANMLAELLGVRILAIVRGEKEPSEEAAQRGLKSFKSGKAAKRVSPHYYAEPNITLPKQA